MDTQTKIRIDALSVAYDSSVVLSNIDLAIRTGEVVCLVGASGCGKSTLVNAVAGLVHPFAGSIHIDDRPVLKPGADRVMVFQDDAVFPWMTVRDNVEFGLRVKGLSRAERQTKIDAVLRLVELDAVADAYPRQLSGGMRKRVDLARALAVDPEILLMDEPYGALDAMTKERMQAHFLASCEKSNRTAIFVTHDLEEAIFLGDRIGVLGRNPGRVSVIIDVPFAHPRESDVKRSSPFQKLRGELAARIS